MDCKTAVLGAGSWGTALACHLVSKGIPVTLWARSPETVDRLIADGENRQYLPGIALPRELKITAQLEEALRETHFVVLAVPSQAIRHIAVQIRPLLKGDAFIISTAKGLEQNTYYRMSEVLSEELPHWKHQIAVLSGPSHAEEVARQLPTAVVVSSFSRRTAELVQDLFMNAAFRVYTNPDIIGVELGGALKNIIALATGIADGLGFGDNTRAALMTRGAVEIARLGTKMGAEILTFAGLAGIGDLIVTCSSMHSRNRRAGIALGKGVPLAEVLASMGMVVEGVTITKTVYQLAQKLQVPMPIATEMYHILFEGKDALQSVDSLMRRSKTHELEEIAMAFDQSWQFE
ncbi:MAG TPA: NAD(P)H-dependent glycerol-3-phosphate dehydrogenase [Clostridia bacterium]|nr:NAD(P)H-dependent glycerol-3-phosphate dehydrogenase [Clostridia bacterium]